MFVIYLDCFDPSLKNVLDPPYALRKYANNNHYPLHLLDIRLYAEPVMNIIPFNSHKSVK